VVQSEFGAESKTSGQKVKSGDALNLLFESKGSRMRNGATRAGIRMNKRCSGTQEDYAWKVGLRSRRNSLKERKD
jgi:hypothetical protein